MPHELRDLGPASVGFPVSGAALAGGRIYAVSRNVSPPTLASFDPRARRAREEAAIPSGVGAWGVAADRERSLYIGQFGARGRPNLYRYDLSTRSLRDIALLDVDYVWDLAVAPDGVVYGVTAPDMVFAYRPDARRADDIGLIARDDRVRSVAVDDARVYVGGARAGKALLLSADRATRRTASILPAPAAAHQGIYTVRASRYHVIAGTRGPGASDPAILAIDRNDPRVARVGVVAHESVVDTVQVHAGAVWGTARPSGALYRLDLGSGHVQRVAVPVPLAETRALFVHDGKLVGVSAPPIVWSYDPATTRVERIDLLDAGLRGKPELTQSLAASQGNVYVGGNFGFTVLDTRTLRATRFFVPGEPKDLAVAGDTVYLGLYPGAELWSYRAGAPPGKVAQLPVEQNRPVAVAADTTRGVVAVGTAADRRGGGALHLVDARTGRVQSLADPLGGGQHVAGITATGGIAYVGGGSADARLGAFDIATGRLLWVLEGVAPGGGALAGLDVGARRLYALSVGGRFAIVDLTTRRVVYRARVPHGGGRLRLWRAFVYGATPNALLAFNPHTGASEVVVASLGSRIWGWPSLAVDADALYVVKGMNVARVTVAP